MSVDDVLDHLLPDDWRERAPWLRVRGFDVPRPDPTHRLRSTAEPDAVGNFAEGIARFLGTGRFLAVQTIIVIVWITLNVVAVTSAGTPTPSSC